MKKIIALIILAVSVFIFTHFIQADFRPSKSSNDETRLAVFSSRFVKHQYGN